MANTYLTNSLIAKEAVMQLDNELVMAKKVFRGYEDEFKDKTNGYATGASITIKRPMDFTVTDGAVMSTQAITEGSLSLTVNKRKHVAFEITAQEKTLSIKEISKRIIKPAMIQLANKIDADVMALYKDIPSWVGTAGQTINSYTDFAKGPERMDEYANPNYSRCAVLSPADHWGLLGSQTALFIQDAAKGAYRKGSLGMIGGVDTYMSQNVPSHTVGTYGGTPLTNGATQETTWAASLTSNTQTLITDGWTSGGTTLNAGDVFTIANVYAVNPITKATLPFLKQFTVVNQISDTTGDITLTMSPAAILTGAFQNISATIADGAAITIVGTSATGYRQNMVFTENAFALVTVPLAEPAGAVDVTRENYKGTHVRLIPVYDGINDVSKYRLDVLYGVKTIDERCAHRISGTA